MGICRKWRPFLFFLPILLFIPLLFSVIELYRVQTPNIENPSRHSPSKSPKNKFDHLVLGPAAGQGLRNRIQCQGLKALNTIHFSASSHIFNFNDNISFVTVFSVYNNTRSKSGEAESSDTVIVGNTSYNKVHKAMAILNVFINFIQAFLETKLEEHLSRQNHINHYIFTDSDMAVVDDLSLIFEKYRDFHLALTFRNNKNQPLNSGFIAVRGTPEAILKAKTFLEVVLEVYISRFRKASYMLGDQLALAYVIKSYTSFDAKKFTKPEAFLDTVHGASVLFLPCAVYNWTPPEGAGQFHGMPMDVKVIHFKGSRKRLMLESWNFLNSSSFNLSDMLCLILASGRTKYDF